MTIGNKLIGNSAFLFLDWLAITVLSLVFWMIIGKTLPQESYGIVATSLNIIVLLSGITLLGINATIVKLISEFNQRRQEAKIRSLMRFSIKVVLLVSSIFSAAIILLSPVLSPILNLPPEVLTVVAVGVFVFSVWTLTTSVMSGFQSMKEIMKTDFVGNLVKVVLTFFLVLVGSSYFGPLIGLIAGVTTIILLRLGTLTIAAKKIGGGSARLNFGSIFTYSTSAFVISVAMLVFSNTPNIILNAITGSTITALFAVSLTIASPIFSIPGVLNSALFPITSALSVNRGGVHNQKILINMVIRYASLTTLPVIMILLMFSGTIILLFSNESFLPATSILPLVGFGAFFFGVGGILNTSIYAVRRPKVSRNITILAMVVFLALSFPLTVMFSMTGMAIAYLVAVFVFCAASLIYLRKFTGLSLDWPSLLKIAAALLIFSGMLFALDSTVENVAIKFVGVIVSSVVYLALLIPLRFYKKEDLKVLSVLSEKSPVGKKLFRGVLNLLSKYV